MALSDNLTNPPVEWNDLISDPSAIIYSHPAIAKLYEQALGHKAYFLHVNDGSQKITAGIVFYEKKLFPKIPVIGNMLKLWYTFAPPVIRTSTNSKKQYAQLFETIKRESQSQGVLSISIRSSPQFTAENNFPSEYRREKMANVVVDLRPDIETIQSSIGKSLRKNIRSAENQLKVRQGTLDDVKDYYQAYAMHHKERGLGCYPRSFFEGLVTIFEKEKLGEFWVAEKDNHFAAGLMVSEFNNRLYEMALTSNPKYNPFFPNDLLKWTAIQYGKKNGHHSFDLSNIDPHAIPGSPTAGINRYKQKWGNTIEYGNFKKQHPIIRLLK